MKFLSRNRNSLHLPKFISWSLFFLFLSFPPSSLLAGTQSLQVRLKNGTTGGPGKADSIRVLVLKEAMLPIHEEKNIAGEFTLKDLDLPEGVPVLLQVNYQGATYNKMVPPVPEMRKQVQDLEIYESTVSAKNISARSLLQIVRGSGEFQIIKIILLQNETKPPRAYRPESGLDIYVPEGATGLTGSWTQGSSKMGIPLQFQSKGKGIQSMDRAVLPGSTEIQISYSYPVSHSGETEIPDQILFEEPGKDRPIFIRPVDMKVEFSSDPSPREVKEEIPDGVRAFYVGYSSESKSTVIRLSGGTPVLNRFSQPPRQIVNGSILPTWDLSLISGLGILALFFSLGYLTEYLKKKKGI